MATLTLPLICILDKQAQSDQSDVNLLLGLLGMIPNISDESFRNVRELIALRMLEVLCLEEGFEGPESSAKRKKVMVEVDTSESCENVVIEVFMLLKNKDSRQHLSRLDLRRFIEHKRSVLRGESSIEKLKDAIHTGRISLFSFSGKGSDVNSTSKSNTIDDKLSSQYLLDQKLKLADMKRKLLDIRKCRGLKQTSHNETEVHKDEFDRNAEARLDGSEKLLVINETAETFENGSVSDGDNHLNSEISRGIDECLADIDAKKKLFLSSYCKDTPETNWREPSICMKCKRGGELLVCSNTSCPFVFHEKCLGLEISLETGESFYCKFCDFAQGITRCEVFRNKASLARKNLHLFHYPRVANRKTGTSSGSIEQEQMNEQGMDVDEDESDKKGFVAGTTSNGSSKHSTSSQSGKCEEESKKSAFLTDEKRDKKPIYPQIPSFRQPKRWTSEEEEALLEGMRVIWKPEMGYIPWKRILEYGASRFHPTRTPVDLKDKWRNLCKGDQHPLLKHQ